MKSAFARLLGCPKSRVSEWIGRQVLTPPAVTRDGLIAPSLAVAQLDAAGCLLPLDPHDAVAAVAAIAEGTVASGMSYDEARTATETLKAHRALLDLRSRRGELVERDLAEGVLFDALREVRDAWQAWPGRIAAVMAARLKVDPADLLAELERGVREQLAAVGDPKADWRRRSQEARAGSRSGG